MSLQNYPLIKLLQNIFTLKKRISKSESPKLPNNQTPAEKWFQSLENKFAKDPVFPELYIKQINEYIDLGHAAELANDHSLNILDITNYVPHHGVLNINKRRRFRVVFDAYARYTDTCFNHNLLPGPNLLNNLVSALIRSHQGKYAVKADVRECSIKFVFTPNDTNALRFSCSGSPDEVVSDYKLLVHIFGLPYCANRTFRKVPEMVDKSLKDVVSNNFCMDDCIDG